MQTEVRRSPGFPFLAALLAASYAAVALYLWLGLGYDFMRSDVLWYWTDSLSWQAPFNSYHVPGYPLCIALVRAASFGLLPPILVMMSINLAALLVGAWAVFRIGQVEGLSTGLSLFGAAAFGLWPFVGLCFSVSPLADVPAMALFLTGLLCLLQGRLFRAALLLGVGMVFHKALWPFVGLTTVACIVAIRPRRWVELWALVLLGAPGFALWLGGTLYHGSPLWIVSLSASIGRQAGTDPALMAGFLAPVQQGLFKALVKGSLIWSLAGMAVLIPVVSWVIKAKRFPFILSICLANFFLFLYLTNMEIWAAVRFSRLQVVPLVWGVGAWVEGRKRGWQLILNPATAYTLLVALLASQFAYAWYMARVFFSQ